MNISSQAADSGPRLAGRLTAELIVRSPQYTSCIKLYQLDLRGNRFNRVESLGVTKDQFDCIDFSDNSIVRLEGFPRLEKLTMLLCSNNCISSIGLDIADSLPNLDTLVLCSNKLDSLSDVLALANCSRLTHLCLLGNTVAQKQEFRLFTIRHLTSLKVLNFDRISHLERKTAHARV